jgi:hypothetical protein
LVVCLLVDQLIVPFHCMSTDRNHPNVIVTPTQAAAIAASPSLGAWAAPNHAALYPTDKVSPHARRSLLANANVQHDLHHGYTHERPMMRRQYSWDV